MAKKLPAVVVPPPPASNPVNQALEWIRFGTEGNYNSIRNEGGMESFDYFFGLAESNIIDMAFGFSKRITSQGCINFGMRRVKYTLGIMHWKQNESR